MPHFRKGYDERLDLTEDEYLAQLLDNADELDDSLLGLPRSAVALLAQIEGEPNEDTYLPGIPDYDRFNRPSWGTDDDA